MEDRLEVLRACIDGMIAKAPKEDRRYFTGHLFRVSHFSALLALRRGCDPLLASTCGMLHDIYLLQTGCCEKQQHGPRSAVLAKELLEQLGGYSPQEIDLIADTIAVHSKKREVHGPYHEILKDADVLHHCLYNPAHPVRDKERERYDSLLRELGAGK